MEKEFLSNMLTQNKMTCSFVFSKLTNENANFKLTEQTASAGFIYRHIGESLNLFGTFFGVPTEIQNTTMGETDHGQGNNIEESRKIIEKGYEIFESLIENSDEQDWTEIVETPFFGSVPKIRLFAHVLFHTSGHAGQISMILSKGKSF